MEALKRLSDLQVVSRVTKELENHLNIAGDQGKTLAEFVIEIARGQKTVDGFKAVGAVGGSTIIGERRPTQLAQRRALLRVRALAPCRRAATCDPGSTRGVTSTLRYADMPAQRRCSACCGRRTLHVGD